MGRLLKNISWIFTGNVISSLIKWLIFILIARILSSKELGIYSLAFAVTSPIALFMNMKLRSLAVTDSNLNFKSYIVARRTLTILSIVIFVIVGLIFYPEYITVLMLVGLSKVLDLHSEIYYSLPQIKNDFNFIGKLMILKHLFIFIFFATIILITNDLILSLMSQLLAQLIFFIMFEKRGIIRRYPYVNSSINKREVKKIIAYGLPLGFSLMLISLNSNIPKYLLEYFTTTEMVGFYTAITYVVVIGNLLMNSISQNFLPKLTNLFNNKKIEEFKKYIFIHLTGISIFVGAGLILFSYLFGELFLQIVYGSNFVEYVDILIIMSIAVTFNFISWNFDTAIMSMRYISVQPKISFIVLIVSFLSSYFLIPLYGINGAAYAMTLTFLSQLLLRLFVVIKKLKMQEDILIK